MNARKRANFCRYCYFWTRLSDKSAKNSDLALFLALHLYYNKGTAGRGLLQENGGTPVIRREIPLRTKKPRPGFRAQAGLCPKIPKMSPKNRETRNRSRRAEAMRRAK